MWTHIIQWIMVIVAVEAMVEIIVSADVTLRIRVFFSKVNPGFLGKLFSCGYCMSVWVAGSAAWMLPGEIIDLLPIDIIIKTLIVHRASNVWHECIARWFKRLPFEFVVHNVDNEPSLDNPVVNDTEVNDTEVKEDGKG